jgi:hypothetical protein
MTREQDRRRTLEALDRILNLGGDADDVLRDVVRTLGSLYDSVAIAFVEEDELAVGPTHGPRPQDGTLAAFPIAFDGSKVGELQVAPAPDDDSAFLERVALIVSPYCLVGWDTGGIPWDDL